MRAPASPTARPDKTRRPLQKTRAPAALRPDEITFAVRNDSMPVRNDSFPVRNAAFRIDISALRVRDELFRIDISLLPVRNAVMSLRNKVMPLRDDTGGTRARRGGAIGHLAGRGMRDTLRGMRYKTILLFGAPGSGKGTQGKILGSIPGFFHTACGDVFRQLDLKSELGKTFWEYSSQGKLVPDDLTVKLWKNFIDGAESTSRFHPETEILVLDGIPRNIPQARIMDQHLDVIKVIYLVCADMSKMVERLKRRALKENRMDDASDKVIQHRLEVYERETRPVLEHYPAEKIAQVDATMSQMKVLQKIIDVLVPIKSAIDHARETQERAGLAPAPAPAAAPDAERGSAAASASPAAAAASPR